MAFIFTCGTHNFRKQIKGTENLVYPCARCNNWTARPVTDWEWFTFCFIPIIPFSFKPHRDLHCHICNFEQALEARSDADPVVRAIENGQQPPAAAGGYHNQQQGPPQQAYMSSPNGPGGPQAPQQAHGQQQYGQPPPQGYYGPPDGKRYG